ncbi:MAG: hypothetical protein RI967_1394, partial [Planctomycetota bacterium]
WLVRNWPPRQRTRGRKERMYRKDDARDATDRRGIPIIRRRNPIFPPHSRPDRNCADRTTAPARPVTCPYGSEGGADPGVGGASRAAGRIGAGRGTPVESGAPEEDGATEDRSGSVGGCGSARGAAGRGDPATGSPPSRIGGVLRVAGGPASSAFARRAIPSIDSFARANSSSLNSPARWRRRSSSRVNASAPCSSPRKALRTAITANQPTTANAKSPASGSATPRKKSLASVWRTMGIPRG